MGLQNHPQTHPLTPSLSRRGKDSPPNPLPFKEGELADAIAYTQTSEVTAPSLKGRGMPGRAGGESVGAVGSAGSVESIWPVESAESAGSAGFRVFRFFSFFSCFTCALILLLSSCQKAEHLYSSYPAQFVFWPVTQAPQLNTALNNMGEFCTITPSGDYYVFSNTKGSTRVALTAIDQSVSARLGLDGFIVGLPNMPEMGYDTPRVVCFDLCCPNCYRDLGITRRLALGVGGTARCARCTRTYDLNNLGMVSSDTTGVSLLRYRVYYEQMNNRLTISNR